LIFTASIFIALLVVGMLQIKIDQNSSQNVSNNREENSKSFDINPIIAELSVSLETTTHVSEIDLKVNVLEN
jgi:hypothetical protein